MPFGRAQPSQPGLQTYYLEQIADATRGSAHMLGEIIADRSSTRIASALERIADTLARLVPPVRVPTSETFKFGNISPEDSTMAGNIEITDQEKFNAGWSINDADGQPFTTPPAGYSAVFSMDDGTVPAPVAGTLTADFGSGKVGTTVARSTLTRPDGTTKDAEINVTVKNSGPGSEEFTAGVVSPE